MGQVTDIGDIAIDNVCCAPKEHHPSYTHFKIFDCDKIFLIAWKYPPKIRIHSSFRNESNEMEKSKEKCQSIRNENENKNETEIASILQMFIIPFRLHVFK